MANCLVTGGAGFIGSHIVEGLLERGDTVRVVDSLLTGKKTNIDPMRDKIEFIEGDLTNPDICKTATKDIELIFHEAALPSVPRSIDDPVGSASINVMGTVNLLHAAVQAKVKRVVYAGSSSAYGEREEEFKHERLLPQPISPYAAGKLAGEYFLHSFHHAYGLETVSLRYFNVFGPRQDPKSLYGAVIPVFIDTMLEGRQPTIYGDGSQSRDFTYVGNVVKANLLAAGAGREAIGRMMNVACGKAFTLLDLMEELNKVMGTEIEPIFAPARNGDILHSLADIRAARQLLGYEADVDFTEGLKKTVEFFNKAK